MNEEPLAKWMFIAKEGAELDRGAIARLANEAIAAVPPGVLAGGGDLLPRVRPPEATCRICGAQDRLSREHIPPRAAGNTGTYRAHSITDWIARDSLDDVPGGRHFQGCSFGFVLCESCNSRTGRLAPEYAKWATMAIRLFVDELPPVTEMDHATVTPVATIGVPQCQPGKFARQVLSMMASLAGRWPVTELHPQLKSSLLDGTPCELPGDLTLDMALCAPVAARYAGPTLVVDLPHESWRWIASLAYPPLAFELELARSDGDHVPSPLCGIGHFLEHSDDLRADVELELIVGFAHTAFPSDWRTRAQIESDRDLYGRLPTDG